MDLFGPLELQLWVDDYLNGDGNLEVWTEEPMMSRLFGDEQALFGMQSSSRIAIFSKSASMFILPWNLELAGAAEMLIISSILLY